MLCCRNYARSSNSTRRCHPLIHGTDRKGGAGPRAGVVAEEQVTRAPRLPTLTEMLRCAKTGSPRSTSGSTGLWDSGRRDGSFLQTRRSSRRLETPPFFRKARPLNVSGRSKSRSRKDVVRRKRTCVSWKNPAVCEPTRRCGGLFPLPVIRGAIHPKIRAVEPRHGDDDYLGRAAGGAVGGVWVGGSTQFLSSRSGGDTGYRESGPHTLHQPACRFHKIAESWRLFPAPRFGFSCSGILHSAAGRSGRR